MSGRRVGAVVLCGGESRRMGRPKALLPIGGRTMLEHVIDRVKQAASEVVVVAAPGQTLPDLDPSIKVARDEIGGHGPLQGLAAGFLALPDSVSHVFACATDVPRLVPAWIERLNERIGDHDLAIPSIGGFHHPLAALYQRERVLPAIQKLLSEGRMRPFFLVEMMNSIVLDEHDFLDIDPDLQTLRNLNTPEDFDRLLDEEAQLRKRID